MLSPEKVIYLELVCHATVSDWLASMCNPKYRGRNFTWEHFPEMMAKHCRGQVALSVRTSPDETEQYLSYAEKFGRKLATSLVKTMTE